MVDDTLGRCGIMSAMLSKVGIGRFSRMSRVAIVVALTLLRVSDVKSEIKPTQEFNLKTAVRYAIENSPAFDSIKNRMSISALEEKNAAAKLFPSVDLSSKHGILDSTPRGATGPWSSEFSLSVLESLYDNGIGQINSKIASLDKTRNELLFQEQRDKFVLEIVSRYLDYSLSVKSLEIQEKQFKLVSKQYETTARD